MSKIARSVTGGRASVSDLRRWNKYLTSDTIQTGKALWLADPNDELVKVLSQQFGEQATRRNPEIDVERMDPALAEKYAGVTGKKYRVEMQLKYDAIADSFLNPSLLTSGSTVDICRSDPYLPLQDVGMDRYSSFDAYQKLPYRDQIFPEAVYLGQGGLRWRQLAAGAHSKKIEKRASFD